VSDFDDHVYFVQRVGASGFLLRSTRPAELIAVVRAAVGDVTLLAPGITRRLAEAFVTQPPAVAARSPVLEACPRAS
jgi:DNA-binding NarL/FixJ family response regulator